MLKLKQKKMEEIYYYIIAGTFIIGGLFIGLRELGCWYWKINERLKAQNLMNLLLEKILDKLTDQSDIEEVKTNLFPNEETTNV